MLKRIIEHREYMQLRKDQMHREKMKQAPIVIALCVAALAVVGIFEQTTPDTKSVKPGAAVYQPVNTVADADKFADLVTMPAEDLTPDDLAFLKSKENDPCYAGNVDVEQGMMAEEIKTCEAER